MPTLSLRAYQTEATAQCLAHLRAGRATLLVSPTGSGKTIIAAAIAGKFKRVIVIAHRKEILDQARAVFGFHVVALSIQALSRPGGLKHIPFKNPDFVIYDEAHRAPARTGREVLAHFPNAALLGMTATPYRLDGKGLGDIFAEMHVACTTADLMESGHLVQYRALEAPDEALRQLAHFKKIGGDYNPKQLGALMNQPRLVGDVVREYVKHGGGRKAVCFAVNIEHSIALEQAFLKAGVRAVHLDGHASAAKREAGLRGLERGEYDVLCNVNLFTEGWDCPAVDCVIMARPTASLTLYLQCVGRGMRPAPGKDDLLILDHAGNIQRHGYPDEKREWSLESEAQKAKRLAEIAELERLAALGYDSVEAELAERERMLGETYSSAEACKLLGIKVSRGISQKAKDLGWEGFGSRYHARYAKCLVDAEAQKRLETYSKAEVCKLIGVAQIECLAEAKTWRTQFDRYEKLKVDGYCSVVAGSYSAREVAGKLKISYAGVGPYLKIRGIVPSYPGGRDCPRFPKNAVDALADLISNSYSRKEAAALLQTTSSNVGNLLTLRGIIPVIYGRKECRYPKAGVDMAAAHRSSGKRLSKNNRPIHPNDNPTQT